MTREEFLTEVKRLWKTVEAGNLRLEMLIQIAEIAPNNDTITDLAVESTNCIVCQYDLLGTLIENQGLTHSDEDEPEPIH